MIKNILPSIRFLLLVILIFLFIKLNKAFSINLEKIDNFLIDTPLIYSSIIFIFLYVVGTSFILYLKDPLKLVGAIIFGAYLSTLLIYISEIINSYIFFHLSSFLGKEFVEHSLKGRFKKSYERLGNINLGWVFLLRAIPLVPYRILDISFGLSKLPYRKYLLAVIFASPPRIFAIQFPLAAVRGFSIEKMRDYFINHPIILLCLFLYIIFALVFICIFTFKLRKN
jgi:uncharacterized membrane protein YdjX (TVP38/TMEM64 family)